MARLQARTQTPGDRILVVDDDPVLLESTEALLTREGYAVAATADPTRAVEKVRSWKPALILLDYFMPSATGADIVRAVRAFDRLVQIVLVTGYASEKPARAMLGELDIQGYHDKADGPDRLLVLVESGLKHHLVLSQLERQRRALRQLVEASGELGRLQPLESLCRVALDHLARQLLPRQDGTVGAVFVTRAHEGTLEIRAANGAFAAVSEVGALPPPAVEAVAAGLASASATELPSGYIAVGLPSFNGSSGAMVLQGYRLPTEACEVCNLLARQVALALENVLLFARATLDPLTGLYTRGYGQQRIREALALAARGAPSPTSVLLLDFDRFKSINDTWGHAAGDLALQQVARVVRSSVRSSDVVVRWGGEEILVLAPATPLEGARRLAERMRKSVAALRIPAGDATFSFTASVGFATEPGGRAADAVVAAADAALYRAKNAGRDRVCGPESAP
jgi:diguanylate cyclase (GGDEF)-like protein